MRQAFLLLRAVFSLGLMILGVDKFFNFLANWDHYLVPLLIKLLGIHSSSFMLGVGICEIIMGIGVYIKPKYFAYVVFAWLLMLSLYVLFLERFYRDIAIRDGALAFSALALARLSSACEKTV
jgi:hypothetical protein